MSEMKVVRKADCKPLVVTNVDERALIRWDGASGLPNTENGPAHRRAISTNSLGDFGRDAGIRTRDPLTPSQVRYQAALHPVTIAENPLGTFSEPWNPL